MFVINVSDPFTLLLITLVTVLLIFLGKEVKRSFVPGLALFAFLILVSMHSIQLSNLAEEFYEVYYPVLVRCILVDCIMIFMSFFAYLWVDDIAAKFYKKKSIDNSLDWFWNKV